MKFGDGINLSDLEFNLGLKSTNKQKMATKLMKLKLISKLYI